MNTNYEMSTHPQQNSNESSSMHASDSTSKNEKSTHDEQCDSTSNKEEDNSLNCFVKIFSLSMKVEDKSVKKMKGAKLEDGKWFNMSSNGEWEPYTNEKAIGMEKIIKMFAMDDDDEESSESEEDKGKSMESKEESSENEEEHNDKKLKKCPNCLYEHEHEHEPEPELDLQALKLMLLSKLLSKIVT